MAQSLHELMLAELPLGGVDAPVDGATDSVGMRERIVRCRTTVDAAATGEMSRMSMEEARQDVRDAQSALLAFGYGVESDASSAAGWGADTAAALQDFQEDYGLRRTGHLDAVTYEVLMAAYEQAVETHSGNSDDSDEEDLHLLPAGRES